MLIASVGMALVLLLASMGAAVSQHNGLLLNRIVILEDSQPAMASVVVENDAAFDFDDGKVVAVIPELGIRASSQVDLDAGERDMARVLLDLEDAPAGEYWVRLTITTDDEQRIRHRLITIG